MIVSDYVIKFLEDRSVSDVFLVSGGGIMYLLDSIGRSEKIRYHCNYHEQASAVAAEGYARVSGKPGVCIATVGPGAINAISGLLGSWVDSIPLLLITGQVRTTLIADYQRLRQFGPQEANAVGVAKPVTKYSVSVTEPSDIRYVMEKAFYELQMGRPGPVLVEIPLDVQSASIDPDKLRSFVPPMIDSARVEIASVVMIGVVNAILNSRRPLIVAGNGIRLSGCTASFAAFIEKFNIPVVVPFSAKDLVSDDHSLFMGVFGTAGQRRANYAVQNSDCIIAIGAGLNVQKVGFNPSDFARSAVKVIVDIDASQLLNQAVKADIAVEADAGEFLSALDVALSESQTLNVDPRWLSVCARWRSDYPPLTEAHFSSNGYLTSYFLINELSDRLTSQDVVVTGNGIEVVSLYQAFRVKAGQRILISGWGSMGWDLPMTFGASIAVNGGRVVCVCGDGSFQWNVQELLTISRNARNVKIFIVNNAGYTAIRTTQDNLFDGRYVGADSNSGVFNPNFEYLAKAYGFSYSRILNTADAARTLDASLSSSACEIVECVIDPKQTIFPKASSYRRPDGTLESRPLEDMSPFLPREEHERNMSYFV